MNEINVPEAKFHRILRLVIHSPIVSPEDNHQIEFGTVEFARDPDAFSLYCLDQMDTSSVKKSVLIQDAAEAWSCFVKADRSSDGCVLIGPGNSPITFLLLRVEAAEYRVFDATLGIPVHIGSYHHRLQAMQATKQIVEQGGCPVGVSPHLPPLSEWTTERVVSSVVLSGGDRELDDQATT
ncbi:hypothetical protein [Novipirellula rosea]